MSANTKFAKQSILGKPPSSSRPKPYAVPTLPNSTAFPKVGETNALSNPVTSNSVPSSRESTVVNNERVIAPGIFRINPVKANRVANFVPNKHVKTSVRTKPIIVPQPHDDCVRHKSESQSDCSKGDNACTSNPQEPINKRFPSSTFSMSGCQKWFDTLLIPLLSEYNLEDKEDHGDNECEKRNLFGLAYFSNIQCLLAQSMACNQDVRLQRRFFNNKGSDRFRALLPLKEEKSSRFLFSRYKMSMTSMSSAVTTADASDKCQQQQDSTSSTSTLATAITADKTST
ncbi:hypothetical protein Tco_0769546 [Tanacetum coccineum]|uniref:Uncharacterized protein n=1 Tax=Tanacetum coccineum TaxID=301880 RepID=A0ABQ4ZA16_9ASTR